MVCVLYKNLKYKLKTTVDPIRFIGVDRLLDALSDPRFPSFYCFFFVVFLFFFFSFFFLSCSRDQRVEHRSTPLGACGWSFIKISNCLTAASEGSSRTIKTALRLSAKTSCMICLLASSFIINIITEGRSPRSGGKWIKTRGSISSVVHDSRVVVRRCV